MRPLAQSEDPRPARAEQRTLPAALTQAVMVALAHRSIAAVPLAAAEMITPVEHQPEVVVANWSVVVPARAPVVQPASAQPG
jgi:hypothetical protein